MNRARPEAVRIASVATASPGLSLGQQEARDFLVGHFADRMSDRGLTMLRRVFAHPSVRTRRLALSRPEQLVGEGRQERAERFAASAVELGFQAAGAALEAAAVAPREVEALVVNTCTGYLCPGLSGYLAERLGLGPEVRAYDLVGSGCSGALPNLELAAGALEATGGNGGGAALSVSVEICSAVFRMGDDPSLIVSNALFADGAAAAALRRGAGPLRVVGSGRRLLPEHREAIRFVHRDGELHNQLAAELPELVGRAAGAFVPAFLAGHGLTVADIPRWAVHPGGEKVLAAVDRALGLGAARLAASRAVLAEHGNLSSATVWFVLRRLMDQGLSPGERLVMLAFGAGMSIHACLLEAVG